MHLFSVRATSKKSLKIFKEINYDSSCENGKEFRHKKHPHLNREYCHFSLRGSREIGMSTVVTVDMAPGHSRDPLSSPPFSINHHIIMIYSSCSLFSVSCLKFTFQMKIFKICPHPPFIFPSF